MASVRETGVEMPTQCKTKRQKWVPVSSRSLAKYPKIKAGNEKRQGHFPAMAGIDVGRELIWPEGN